MTKKKTSRIIMILTMKCGHASQLLSDEQDWELDLAERIALRMHLFICGPCRRFKKQLAFIREIMNRLMSGQTYEQSLPAYLTDEQKAMLIEKINRASQDKSSE